MKSFLLFICAMLASLMLMAQFPNAFKYQAIVRDNAGIPIVNNNNVWFKISIIRGSVTGTTVYSELHAASTNNFGLVELSIGRGTSSIGNFSTISWHLDSYYIRVEMDPQGGGTAFQFMGISQLLSVPYAISSKRAEEIPDFSVTNAKIANNAVTISKLPAGASASTFLRGDGTWQIPPSSGSTSPAGTSGSIQYNYGGNFYASQYLHWDYANYRLGIGTNLPDSKVQIVSSSSATYPQLKLYESSTGYSRMNFQNSSGSTYWAIVALNSATNANERFNIYNSTSGNAISISGVGHIGVGVDPSLYNKLYVKDDGNVYSGYFENSGSYSTLLARNYGTGPAANLISNGSTYTLYAQNLGTGPAAYFDGTLQVAGGNTAEINRNQTGSSNIVPVCYGSVEASGTKNNGGSTANFTCTKISTGVYDITLSGETYAQTTHCAIASLGDSGFINTNAVNGKLRIYTFSASNATVAQDREFSFVIFRP